MAPDRPLYIGTAGWNIPRVDKECFPADGSQLARYGSRFNAAEINTSFYRPHARATYERWAAAVPQAFRFAVKVPKTITHERGLTRVGEPLERFLDQAGGLGARLCPLLVQLPPSHAFDVHRVGRFFERLRTRFDGDIVCEPRHATWSNKAADRLLEKMRVARVAADPPRADGFGEPGGWTGLAYYRWHGSPRTYFSPYSDEQLRLVAATLVGWPSGRVWCIFDNTGSGAAAGNALDLVTLCR